MTGPSAVTDRCADAGSARVAPGETILSDAVAA
jgi:hypothetical protein